MHSLRSRYAIISLMLGLLVLLAAVFGNYLLFHTREKSTQHIEKRRQLLAQSRQIRNDMWRAREAIGQFLIDPDPKQNRELVHTTIHQAITSSKKLLAMSKQLDSPQLNRIRHVENLTENLQAAANRLITIRLDTSLQFPSLVLARDEMLPRQQTVFDAFTSALDETSSQKPRNFAMYQLLVKARYRWSTIISDVRMLIASRLGSYSMDSVSTQEHDIDLYITDFNSTMNKLKAMQSDKNMGFDTSIAIDEIIKDTRDWHKSYQKLIDIHNSDKWRSDSVQLHNRINPLLENIWSELLNFDAGLELSAESDIQRLGSVAQKQTATIWGIGIIALIVIVFGYKIFDRAVLKPMHILSKAFLQEARHGREVELPKVSSTETQKLIQAFVEMRDQIHTRQLALEFQTQHDTLTGLANRNLLYQRLEQVIGNSKRHCDNISLILLDLDRFKEANDALGHHIGDQLLIEVGNRLRDELRGNDLVARLGGDEFAIILSNADETQTQNVCKKILKCFERPFLIQQHQLYVGASLGIAIHPHHGHDAETLMQRADIAMYVAKRNHLGYTFYEDTTDQSDTRYLSLAHDLRSAVNEETLTLMYQLKYDVTINQPIGAEALLRWMHPTLGEIEPSNIIPLAEQLGIINRLTSWVMQEAISQCAQWRQQGIFMSMAVNLSVYDLLTADLIGQIQKLLDEYELPPSYLVIEITENAMLIDPNNAISILRKLDAMGVRIAIDDFGVGFSSLGYLKKLPVDELKIDKSFVLDMNTNENDAVIVRSTIDLAHNLGLKVVAEGVETEEIYESLRNLHCDTAQGYFLAKPDQATTITRQLAMDRDKKNRPFKLG